MGGGGHLFLREVGGRGVAGEGGVKARKMTIPLPGIVLGFQSLFFVVGFFLCVVGFSPFVMMGLVIGRVEFELEVVREKVRSHPPTHPGLLFFVLLVFLSTFCFPFLVTCFLSVCGVVVV